MIIRRNLSALASETLAEALCQYRQQLPLSSGLHLQDVLPSAPLLPRPISKCSAPLPPSIGRAGPLECEAWISGYHRYFGWSCLPWTMPPAINAIRLVID